MTPYLWVDLRLREVDDDLPVVVVGAAAEGLRRGRMGPRGGMKTNQPTGC